MCIYAQKQTLSQLKHNIINKNVICIFADLDWDLSIEIYKIICLAWTMTDFTNDDTW